MSRENWSTPKPAKVPRPTYWPAVMALATILTLWGIVTSPVISLVGLILFAGALTGWIWELFHDR